MTKRERDLLANRYAEIEAEIAVILEDRIVYGDPAVVEQHREAIEDRLSAESRDEG